MNKTKTRINRNSGFITLLAMVVIVAVTGGTILVGTAIIDGVAKKGCGSSLGAWRSGQIYADLGDGDNIEAIENAQRCQKAVNDAVQTAKPVATLMSSAGNIGGNPDSLAGFVVDRMMDQVDAVSDPDHKVPEWAKLAYDEIPEDVRDFIFTEEQIEPFLLDTPLDNTSDKDSEAGNDSATDESVESTKEDDTAVEEEDEKSADPVISEPITLDNSEEVTEDDITEDVSEIVEEVVEIEEIIEEEPEEVVPEKPSPTGTHKANFNRPSTTTAHEDGIGVMVEETTSGYIDITFNNDSSATCYTNMETHFTTTFSVDGIPPQTGVGYASTSTCTGDLEDGTFLLFATLSGEITIAGQTLKESGPITVTGYINSDGKITGSISIEGSDDIPFQE